MDTSINRSQEQDLRVSELMASPHPEDVALGDKVRTVIIELVKKLKPLLPYITSPYMLTNDLYATCPEDCIEHRAIAHEVRVLLLGPLSKLGSPTPVLDDKEGYLFLESTGYFFSATRCVLVGGRRYHLVDDVKGLPHEKCHFNKLVENLKNALDEAVAKREVYLESIKTRSEKLDEILAILRR